MQLLVRLAVLRHEHVKRKSSPASKINANRKLNQQNHHGVFTCFEQAVIAHSFCTAPTARCCCPSRDWFVLFVGLFSLCARCLVLSRHRSRRCGRCFPKGKCSPQGKALWGVLPEFLHGPELPPVSPCFSHSGLTEPLNKPARRRFREEPVRCGHCAVFLCLCVPVLFLVHPTIPPQRAEGLYHATAPCELRTAFKLALGHDGMVDFCNGGWHLVRPDAKKDICGNLAKPVSVRGGLHELAQCLLHLRYGCGHRGGAAARSGCCCLRLVLWDGRGHSMRHGCVAVVVCTAGGELLMYATMYCSCAVLARPVTAQLCCSVSRGVVRWGMALLQMFSCLF
eukprot:m.408746 g.408746  ORF g.408746 m.408746 type:complete len:338 (+) comp20149_c1_seq6:275-1288(+)